MSQLRTRFGGLLKAHRIRLGMTQEALAERAGISTDMVSKIEGGSSGARFGVIEKLASALGIDPAELFTTELPAGQLKNDTLVGLTSRLAALNEGDLNWIKGVIDAVLKGR
jgi:transcriptional regulator with XRE-family HTH domain